MKEVSRKLVGLIPQIGGKFHYLQVNEEVVFDADKQSIRKIDTKVLYVMHHDLPSMTIEQRAVFNAFAALYPYMADLSRHSYPG